MPSQAKHNSLISNNIRQPCPVGSVPIRRTLKIDLIRLRSLSSKQTTSDVKDISSIGGSTFPYNKNVSISFVYDQLIYYNQRPVFLLIFLYKQIEAKRHVFGFANYYILVYDIMLVCFDKVVSLSMKQGITYYGISAHISVYTI